MAAAGVQTERLRQMKHMQSNLTVSNAFVQPSGWGKAPIS